MSNGRALRIAAAVLALAALPVRTASEAPLAASLSDTGLFEPGSMERVRADHIAFEPRYPLWTDGQSKRRWLHLPHGTAIDKSDPDRWEFPPGTRAWKEFSDGARVETRLIERLAGGSWRFATYVWNAEGTAATLAPEEGIPNRGIPSRRDCLACHEGASAPILGYSAVQLAGLGGARTPQEHAALGYLHGNCGHCHNAKSLEATGLFLAQSAAAPAESAALARASAARLAPEILRRVGSENRYVRMPPLGVTVTDTRGLEAVRRWIDTDLRPDAKETPP